MGRSSKRKMGDIDVSTEKVTTTVVTQTGEPEAAETDLLIRVGDQEVLLSHLTMAKWLIRKCGGQEQAEAALQFIRDHGKLVSQVQKATR